MELFYVDRRKVDRWMAEAEGRPSAASVTAILDHRTLSDGMPMALDSAMRPVEPLCSWFRHLAHEGRQPETMGAYALIVRRLAEFLAQRGADLLSATEADLTAFHRARTESQMAPVSETTWEKDKAAIKKLYTWLKSEGHVSRVPYPAGPHRGPMGSGMSRDLDIRHMTLEQYMYFRDVGLGGMLPNGQVDVAFRGWAPHRNRAALELALMTGMRLQEWSTLLMPELGVGTGRPVEGCEFMVQECAKYRFERRVWVPAAALAGVEVYLMIERPQMVAKAQRTLKARHRDLFMVDRIDLEQGRLHGVYDGRRRVFRTEAMTPEMRDLAIVEGETGLDPLALFIGHGGGMLGASRWDAIRKDAWRRMLAHAAAPQAPRLPRRPFRFHDARHTFALQLLLTLLDRAQERAEAVRRGDRALISRDKVTTFSAVLTVQKALGHKRIDSTYHYLNYLDDPMSAVDEAFRTWAMDETTTYAEIARRVLAGQESRDA